MTDGYFLAAHCVNATSYEHAEVEWEVVYQHIDGTWRTNDGQTILPFLTIPIEQQLPPIPDGWIEHVHREAAKCVASMATPKVSLTEILGIGKAKPNQPAPPIHRRF